MKGGDTMRHIDDACMDSKTYNYMHKYVMRNSQVFNKYNNEAINR